MIFTPIDLIFVSTLVGIAAAVISGYTVRDMMLKALSRNFFVISKRYYDLDTVRRIESKELGFMLEPTYQPKHPGGLRVVKDKSDENK
jgi:hypothetical protein